MSRPPQQSKGGQSPNSSEFGSNPNSPCSPALPKRVKGGGASPRAAAHRVLPARGRAKPALVIETNEEKFRPAEAKDETHEDGGAFNSDGPARAKTDGPILHSAKSAFQQGSQSSSLRIPVSPAAIRLRARSGDGGRDGAPAKEPLSDRKRSAVCVVCGSV